jgi:hypothetical protein
MTQLTLFEVRADQIINDLDSSLAELGLTPEQKKAVYLQILWRLLASELHPNSAAATLTNLLTNHLKR